MQYSIDVKQAIKTLSRDFPHLTPAQVNTAAYRAINHTLRKGKTAASRHIRQTYAVKAAAIKKDITIKHAFKQSLEGALEAQGQPIPLIDFRASQTKKGVSATIKKGERKRINSAFIATLGSGHKGVFARGKYEAGAFMFRHKRINKRGSDLPINEIKTVSIPTMFRSAAVLKATMDQMEKDFKGRMLHELQRISDKTQSL